MQVEKNRERKEQDITEERGRRFIAYLDKGPERNKDLWRDLKPIVEKYVPQGKWGEFQNPSGDYNLQRLIQDDVIPVVKLQFFVDECIAILEKYGEYRKIISIYEAAHEHKVYIGGSRKKMEDMYERAMHAKLHDQALSIVKSDAYLAWFRGTENEQALEDIAHAREEHAKDVISASRVSLSSDFKHAGRAVSIHTDWLGPLFTEYGFDKKSYDQGNVYRMIKDGYRSERPSAVALDVARQYCESNIHAGPNGMMRARSDAREAELDKHDPEYFQGLMKRTAYLERIKAHARMEWSVLRGSNKTAYVRE